MQLGQINLFAWQPLVSIAGDRVVHEWVFLLEDGHITPREVGWVDCFNYLLARDVADLHGGDNCLR
jgi:hypothetical protein